MASPCTSSPESLAGARWQHALRDAVRDVAELAVLLHLPVEALRARCAEVTEFPLLVPRGFIAKMRKGDANDPLLKQVLPLSAELAAAAGFTADPLAEHGLARQGVMQKYRGRALLVATGVCPVHCRYCFRRAFPYAAQLASRGGFAEALASLRRDASIGEVILSGGDPLSLSNRRLAALIEQLDSIASLHSLRIHTRFPIMVPERVDAGLEALLRRTRLKTIVVVHCNHPQELGADVAASLGALASSTHLLLNQAVLLNGVNDRADTLVELSRRLFDCRVLPYYLHLLDRVAGAAHFDVPQTRARELLAAMRAELPGYLVPKLVREVPGELSKTPAEP
jgi:EF-P beta-lysylation protein EpmB